ncbi:MAG: cytochrome ubiquinol oxidase subunit I [Candidatus Latescibacterota bacterium]|nr:MAG: cytochrome ubiquinol oxidase subunit I [Candidatus Latescibacterota bacterium]
MELDVVLLSRIQFALTIMFHYIFPPLTIGLGVLLVFMEAMYHKTRDRQYEAMARFWTKIFAVNFAMGVATGIVMEFQFGTNWATYSRFVGDIFGSALAAEGIFAFFLESGFLAVLVFGWDKVSPRMHLFATIMVSLGSIFSAVWIVVANSWQQTPAGYHIVGEGSAARAEVVDFWAVVFNPSSMNRLGHVLIGAFILGGFFAMSVSAYYILRRRHLDFAKKTFTIALVVATVFSLLQLVSGHDQARTVAETQPAKLAAFEGNYVTKEGGAPLYLFGFPNDEARTVDAGIGVPGLLSFLVHGDFSAPIRALDSFPRDEWPPVAATFQTYHAMVALGFFFIALTLLASFLRLRGGLFERRGVLWVFVFAVIGPYLANQLGWLAAEFGRQPWIVYGLLRTNEAVSKSVPAAHVLVSIVLYSIIYLLLFVIWVYVLDKKIRQGPEEVSELPPAKGAAGGFLAGAARKTGDSFTAPPDARPERR